MAIEQTDNILIGIGYVDVIRKWNELEPDLEVIDIDVAPERIIDTRRPIKDRTQVYYRLEDLNLSLKNLRDTTPDAELLAQKINSHLAFIEAQDKKAPDDLEKYLMDTMGVNIEYVPEGVLDFYRDEVSRMFLDLGLEVGAEYTRLGWSMLQQRRIGKSDVLGMTNEVIEKSSRAIFNAIGRKFVIPYRSDYESTDRPALFWVKGNREGWKLSMNLHSRHDDRWIDGVEQRLGSHEATHIVHGWSIRRNLDQGILPNPACGITTVPGPEQWGMEGLADTIPLFIPEIYNQFDQFGRFFYSHQTLSRLIGNNLHKMIINGSIPESYMVNFIKHYLPGESDQNIGNLIASRREGNVWPSYWGAYEDGCKTFMGWAEELAKKPEAKTRFLQVCFERQMTKPQLELLFHSVNNSILRS